MLPVKVTRLHLAYGASFSADLVPGVLDISAEVSGAGCTVPGHRWRLVWRRRRLRVGDLVVWLEAPRHEAAMLVRVNRQATSG